MATQTNLSRIMQISWAIEKRTHKTRSQALRSAWAIFLNEQIAVEYLTQKINRNKPLPQRVAEQFALFSN